MPSQLFLSHDSRDRVLADVLAKSLQRLTLNQLNVWHSSDTSGDGGLRPGDVWIDEIRSQLSKSKAVVALLTPRSISRPWLLFESGFGAANPECVVIPVCIGIDNVNSVPFPLAMYQSYQLADYESINRFLVKLLARYELPFDEEMAKPVLTGLISRLANESRSEGEERVVDREPTIADALGDLKSHIDKRLLELLSLKGQEGTRPITSVAYSVVINLSDFSPQSADQYLEIDSGMSVQAVLDSVYYMLPQMKPFRYLQDWLLREDQTGINLVIREIGGRVSATSVFPPNSRWTVLRLSAPYSPRDSQDTARWYSES
jgi:hypothetical protein